MPVKRGWRKRLQPQQAAGEIKMGAMKPVEMLQAGLPPALSTPGHAVETPMGFAPLFELPEKATGQKRGDKQNYVGFGNMQGVCVLPTCFMLKGCKRWRSNQTV